MKNVYLAVMALVVAGTSISCSHKVTRIDPQEQVDLSGRQTDRSRPHEHQDLMARGIPQIERRTVAESLRAQ